MRSPTEHIEQAERYADAVLHTVEMSASSHMTLSSAAIQQSEMFLRAADVEIKLAQVQELTRFNVAGG